MWIVYAILSAIFASVMSITIKIGLNEVNPYLSLTIRTLIVFVFCLITIFFNSSYKEIRSINGRSVLFLVITSIATFLTWLFYFLALKDGSVIKVLAIDKFSIVVSFALCVIFLNEKITWISVLGIVLLVIGGILLVIK